MAIFSVELDRRKRVNLNSGDVIGGDVNLRYNDVIAVGVQVGKLVPDRKQTLTVYTPRRICVRTSTHTPSISFHNVTQFKKIRIYLTRK